MLNLKLQYFGYLMRRAYSLGKTLMLGKMEGRWKRGWDGWMSSRTQCTGVWASSRDGEGQGTLPGTVHRVSKSPTGLSDLTTTHSSILAWEIPWTQEPGGLQSLGISKRSEHCDHFIYFSIISLILMLIQVITITENNLLKWRVFVVNLLPCSYKTENDSNMPPQHLRKNFSSSTSPKAEILN